MGPFFQCTLHPSGLATFRAFSGVPANGYCCGRAFLQAGAFQGKRMFPLQHPPSRLLMQRTLLPEVHGLGHWLKHMVFESQ
eukprot:246870-Pyramimonas_sp.AAC.1